MRRRLSTAEVREMLYRPKFCAECGERIVRAEWPLFVSRRFCDLCSSVNRGADLIPAAAVGASVLVGLLGIAVGLRSSAPTPSPLKESKRALSTSSSTQNSNSAPVMAEGPQDRSFRSVSPTVPRPGSASATNGEILPQESARPSSPPVVKAEERYFCGAETKKGTPCSRRVKGPKRCYQHEGAPAMVAQKELLIR